MFMSLPQPSGAFEWTQAAWGDVLLCRPLLDVADHLFTTRNLRLRDEPREWDRVAAALGVPVSHLLLISQVHGSDVAVARQDRTGEWVRPRADVIVSDDPASAIGVRVADCVPVLLADRRTGAVGAAHAGWRGTVEDAAGAAVRAMSHTFGSDPRDLVAAIGPCLGPCCGEVGDEVVEAFRSAGHAGALDGWFARGPSGRPHVDLWTANFDQLVAAGVQRNDVHVARLCTKTHRSLFHSYRADKENAGRMVAAIRCRAAARLRPYRDSTADRLPC
jgi:YfiH family protein